MGSAINIVLLLGITLFSIGAQCAPIKLTRRALAAETVFDVTQFGAVPDSKAVASMAFIKTWRAACDSAGPVLLRIPKGTFQVGKVIFQGPCKANPIKIELLGTVFQSKDPSVLTGNEPAWLISEVDGVTLNGGGTVHGQGEFMWKYNTGHGDTLLPISMMFSKAKNCLIENIFFVNGKGVHFKITASEDMTVEGVHVSADGESPNTDGIVVSNSQRVKVLNCVIGTGDDCIAIGDTNTDIEVAGIICGPGHGISVGSLGKRLNEGNVKKVHFRNCTLTGTTNGARIKTYMGSHAIEVSDVIFDDITMNNVKNPVLIDQSYFSKSANTPSKVHLSDIHFTNIKGTTISPIAVSLGCSSAVPCEGVELNNIDLTPIPGVGALLTECVNTKISIVGKFMTPACEGRAPKSHIIPNI